VQSAEGRGTTFTVSIPLGAGHLPKDRIGASRTQSSTASGAMSYVEEALRWLPERYDEVRRPEGVADAPRPSFSPTSVPGERSGRVLLVDDNADMRDYLTHLLSERWDVEAAGDGASAWRSSVGARPIWCSPT
jgi:hypothetical protein